MKWPPAALLLLPCLLSAQAGSGLEELGLVIPMRDGVRLAADVMLPSTSGRWPTILVRTPYSRKAASMRSYRYFLQRGYALVFEDVRGRNASQGAFGPITQEGPDGNDTINWIAEQAWSNGRVGMVGSSDSGNRAVVGGVGGQSAPAGYFADVVRRRRIHGPLLFGRRRAKARASAAMAGGEFYAASPRASAVEQLYPASAAAHGGCGGNGNNVAAMAPGAWIILP